MIGYLLSGTGRIQAEAPRNAMVRYEYKVTDLMKRQA